MEEHRARDRGPVDLARGPVLQVVDHGPDDALRLAIARDVAEARAVADVSRGRSREAGGDVASGAAAEGEVQGGGRESRQRSIRGQGGGDLRLFIKAYPAETTEAFCDGHVSAFAFFGGVPLSILFDNTTLAVAKILGDGTRRRTITFSELQSHYLFEDRFGRPGKGNDKGNVEGVIGFGRRNFLVPMPRFESFEALNDWLEEQCLKRQDAVLRGHSETIGERLLRDLDALMVLPPTPYDACEKVSTRATSISMVRYRGNDYSVPVAYAHHEVQVRGYVGEVVIGAGTDIIARHRRSYEKADMVFDPLHFLPLLEQKIGALDQAAPLQGWDLPQEFATLRRLLEARMGKPGKREYVQVLRLLETFEMDHVHGAVRQALDLGAIGYDAVKHLVLCRVERRPPRLDLDCYPYLPRARVETTRPSSYLSLMSGTAA